MVSPGPAQEFLRSLGQVPAAPQLPRTTAAPITEPMTDGSLPVTTAEPTQPPPGPSSIPGNLPVLTNPQEVIDQFYKQHGRNPGRHELQAIRALPIIARQLGRRPTKTEMLAFLDGRRENPPNPPAQFEVVSG